MKPKPPAPNLTDSLALADMVWQVGCATVIIVVGALAAGMWLDKILNTKPWLTLVLIVLSIPVSTYLLIRIALRAAELLQKQTKSPDKQQAVDDKQSGDKQIEKH